MEIALEVDVGTADVAPLAATGLVLGVELADEAPERWLKRCMSERGGSVIGVFPAERALFIRSKLPVELGRGIGGR